MGIPRTLRDFQARGESRLFDFSTARLFHSPSHRHFCRALRHPFGRVASQQVRPVGEAESSIQVLMHRDLAARRDAAERLVLRALAPARSTPATGGGPGSATEILNLYTYRTSFTELNFGYGAALAMVLLAVTLMVSYSMFRLRTAR